MSMQAVGAQLMLVCSNTQPNVLPEEERAAEQLYALAERAAQRNLRIGFEALAWGRKTNLFRQAWSIVKRANHPHLGLILDSFHTLSLKDDPSGIAQIPGDKIFFLQLADAPLLVMDVLQWARHYRNFPGAGPVRSRERSSSWCCARATPARCRSRCSTTCSAKRRTGVPRVDAMRSLLYLEGQVRNRLEAAAAQGGEAAKTSARVLDRIDAVRPAGAAGVVGHRLPRVRRRRGVGARARRADAPAGLPAMPASIGRRK